MGVRSSHLLWAPPPETEFKLLGKAGNIKGRETKETIQFNAPPSCDTVLSPASPSLLPKHPLAPAQRLGGPGLRTQPDTAPQGSAPIPCPAAAPKERCFGVPRAWGSPWFLSSCFPCSQRAIPCPKPHQPGAPKGTVPHLGPAQHRRHAQTQRTVPAGYEHHG